MMQPWNCEACKKSGTVRYREHEDVTSVIYKLASAHLRKSAACHDKYGIGCVRCKNLWRGTAKP